MKFSLQANSTTALVASTAATGICTVAVALLWRHRHQQSNAQTAAEKDDGFISHQLLDYEMLFHSRNDAPISTLTWFQGDYRKASPILKERVKLILEANPWLGGRIIKRRRKLFLRYSSTERNNIDVHFVFIDHSASPFSRHTPIDELGMASKSLLLKNGPKQPLWRVSIVPCRTNPESYFALVVSMSHVAADGHTFYNIHNALCCQDTANSSPVVKLITERIATAQQQQVAAMGKAECDFWTSTSYFLSCKLGTVWLKTFGPAVKGRFVLVDEVKMRQLKEVAAEQDGVPFVSTNDVLTSWYFQNSGCSHGLLSINFRNRLQGHTNQHSGNYENIIFYRRADSASPGLIRQSLATLRRVVTKNNEMPGFWETLTSSYAISTNWASFAKPNVIEGCQEELHVPLYNIASFMPSNVSVMCIFRSGPQGLALYLVGTHRQLRGLEKAPFLSPQSLE